MVNNERGSAQITIIIFVVLTALCGGAAYVLYMAKEDLTQKNADIQGKHDAIKKQLGDKIDEFNAQQDQLKDIQSERARWKDDYEDVARTLTEVQQERAEARSQRDEKETLLDETKNNLRTEITNVETELKTKRGELTKLEDDIDTKQAEADEIVTTLKREKDELNKTTKTEDSKNKTAIAQLRKRLRDLSSPGSNKFSAPKPDGEIIFVDQSNSYVMINITRQEGLVPGLPFDVIHQTSGDKPLIKGRIIIKEVKDKFSYGIVDHINDPLHPILKGDKIGNAIFAKSEIRKKTFVLDGSFERHTAEEIEAQIREFGAEVKSEINLYTDYIVVGKKPLMVKRAMQFGIPLMREDQLYRYIQ